jgi:hypothetical protein
MPHTSGVLSSTVTLAAQAKPTDARPAHLRIRPETSL